MVYTGVVVTAGTGLEDGLDDEVGVGGDVTGSSTRALSAVLY